MDIKEKLLDIWKEVLGIDDIGYTDNIMEIGGTSNSIYQISVRAKEKYDISFSPMDMMMYPNIEALEKFLSGTGEEKASADTGVVKVARRRKSRN